MTSQTTWCLEEADLASKLQKACTVSTLTGHQSMHHLIIPCPSKTAPPDPKPDKKYTMDEK